MKIFRLVVWGMHGIYSAGKTMDETFGLIETVKKASQSVCSLLISPESIPSGMTR